MSEHNTATKADIVEHLCLHFTAVSRKEVKQIVDQFFAEIVDALVRGEVVKLPKFGTLSIKDRQAHWGRDFQSGHKIKIAAKRAVHFHASSQLVKQINEWYN